MRKSGGKSLVVGLAALALVLGSLETSAQNRAPRGQRRPAVRQGTGGGAQGTAGQRGVRGRFDPARMREMMVERLKDRLGATDEEWKAIKPLVSDVMEKQFAVRMTGFRFGRRGPGMGGRPGAPSRGPSTGAAANTEADALQQALEKKDTPVKDIEAKLKAFRDARKKREDALKAARDKLRQVLTIRQEATLVLAGILD